LPQQYTAPLLVKAHEWYEPAATATTLVNPGTFTGSLRSVVVPSPSCPEKFDPQHHAVPSPAA
jgi:hypothetical protein